MLGRACCCSCIVCSSDDFERADNADINVGAPFIWIIDDASPGVPYIEGGQCKTDATAGIIRTKEINLSKTVEVVVEAQMTSLNPGDAFILVGCYVDNLNFFYAQYAGDDTITLGIMSNGEDIVINGIDVSGTPFTSMTTGWRFKLTLNFVDWLCEACLQDGDGTEYAAAGNLYFNGGTHVGFGWTVGGGSPAIEYWKVCENQCYSSCIIGYENFDRDEGESLGENWTEVNQYDDGDLVIYSDSLLCFDSVAAGSPRIAMWNTPHPDSHFTQGVAFYYATYFLGPYGPAVFNVPLELPLSIFICADSNTDPQSYIRVEHKMQAPGIGGRKCTIFAAFEGDEIELVSATVDYGDFYPPPSAIIDGEVYGGFDLFELLFFVCVDEYQRVTAYAGNPDTGVAWGPICDVRIPDSYFPPLGGLGFYAGVALAATSSKKSFIDYFQFVKTQHTGQPQITELDLGGTNHEAGDLYKIEIMLHQDTAGEIDLPDPSSSVVTFTIPTATTAANTARELLGEILALDWEAHPEFASVQFSIDPDDPTIILIQRQGTFDVEASTEDAPIASVPQASDGQTIAVELRQEWIRGAYNCPICPPFCEDHPCCDGPLPSPPYFNTPNQVLVDYGGVTGIKIPSGPWAGNYGIMPCWNYLADGASVYGPPFPGVDPATPCDADVDEASLVGTHDGHCEGYNGQFVVTGCGGSLSFHFPTWCEYYYPASGNGIGVETEWGSPGANCANDAEFGFDGGGTCYPGIACDGFFVKLNLVCHTSGEHAGKNQWGAYIESATEIFGEYTSDYFPHDECMQARVLHFTGTQDDYCHWPETITITPLGRADPWTI